MIKNVFTFLIGVLFLLTTSGEKTCTDIWTMDNNINGISLYKVSLHMCTEGMMVPSIITDSSPSVMIDDLDTIIQNITNQTNKTIIQNITNIINNSSNLNITLNTINLGNFNTGLYKRLDLKIRNKIVEKIPSKKTGDFKDIYNAINFLIQTPYANGSVVNVDGGYAAK